ncbi:MAG: MlaD family protein [Bryobacteraceae bacterium]|jgi:phospholipid/cholesterol/gamma-HCH transport system substrate-binding protein
MPQQTKIKWAQLRVGIMAIVALSILGWLIFLLTGTNGLFKSKSDLFAYVGDSSDIAEGAPVRLNGIVVGQVRSVALSGSNDPRRVVKIDMQVDNEYLPSIPVDSKSQVAQSNLLSTRYMNITKGSSSQTVQPGAELTSGTSPALEDLFQQGDTTLSALQDTIKKLDGIIDAIQVGHGTIGKLLADETLYNRILDLANEGDKLVGTLNSTVTSDQNTIGKVLHDNNALYNNVQDSLARVKTLVDDIDHGPGVIGKLVQDPALYDDTRNTIADVRQVLADINAGKGTVGKLLKSDDLHNQIQATIGRLDSLLDKINGGQGTLGQLLVNPQLYDTLNGTTNELHGLLKDFRANPKKFLRIKMSLF